MKRREFIAGLGGAAAWPLVARAQQPAKPPTVGFLGSLTQSAQKEWTAAFVQRLREHDWVEDRTVAIEYRWAEGHSERFAEIAAEFVGLKVNVIVTAGTAAVIAASGPPRSFPSSSERQAIRLPAGSSRAGAARRQRHRPVKRIGRHCRQATYLLHEAIPGLRRLGIMANIGDPIGVLEMGKVQEAARTLGLEAVAAEIRLAADIAPAIHMLNARVDALYVVTEPLVNANRI